MSQTLLGMKLIGRHVRDAIHVALAPVFCMDEELLPGQHVGLVSETKATAINVKPIGIVDPFLTEPVRKGEQFYILLYQNTVTDMKHHWEHPSFKEVSNPLSEDIINEAKEYITNFASKITDMDYESIMVAADEWLQDQSYTYDNTQSYDGISQEEWLAFWNYYSMIRNVKVYSNQKQSFFTCAC